MIHFRDPPRLFEIEKAPRELCTWLEHAQHDGLSATATEQLIQAVESRAGAPSPSVLDPSGVADCQITATLGAGLSAGTGPLVAKVLVTLAAISLGLGTWYVFLRQHNRLSLVGPRVTESALSAQAPSAAAPEVTAPVPLNMDGDANGAEPTAAPVTQPTRARTQTRTTGAGAAHSSDSRVAPPSEQEPASAAAADTSSTRADEYRLLRAARRALSSEPSRALELTAEHSRQYPKGILGQEREAIAIEALARLGRTSEAKSRANSFFSRFPSSPYRSHLEAIVFHSNRQGAGQ